MAGFTGFSIVQMVLVSICFVLQIYYLTIEEYNSEEPSIKFPSFIGIYFVINIGFFISILEGKEIPSQMIIPIKVFGGAYFNLSGILIMRNYTSKDNFVETIIRGGCAVAFGIFYYIDLLLNSNAES